MELYKFNQNTLDYELTNVISKYKVIISVLFISVFSLSFVAIKKPSKEYIETEITLKQDDNQKKLFDRIDELPFEYPDIVKAQMVLETANFKSKVFKFNNNAFGMKLARQRITTAIDDNLNHAVYKSVEESIIDRLLYETKYMSKLSREDYFNFLDKLYAEGDNYSKTLKNIILKNKLK
jgi:uncharacterized FlgJ-related protein